MDLKLVADIQGAEGCKLAAYKDTSGFWTVGYGHFLDQSKDWTGYIISQDQADDWLNQDIELAESKATTLPEWTYLDTICRQNAVTELVFNMGFVKWKQFAVTRRCIQNEDWQGAHDNLLIGPWHIEVGPIRSNRLANYLLNGSY